MDIQPSDTSLAHAAARSPVWFSRLVLWAGAVGVPAFGAIRWIAGPPETPIETAARVGFASAAAVCLWRSGRPGGDAWAVYGARTLTFALQGWYQFVGPSDARAQTAVLVTTLATLAFTSVRDMAALWAWTVVAIAAGQAAFPAAGANVAASIGSETLTAATVGFAVWYTRSLEGALVAQGAALEARVRDRTEALATAVDRLEREVAERRAAEESARRASLAKSTFLANMSHELRTPLNAILGYTDLLLEDAAPGTTPDLQRIRSSGDHLLRMIEDVLDLAKIDAGRIDLRWQVVSIAEVVERAAALVRPLAAARGLALEVPPVEARPLRSDPDRLAQILVNLLSNAVKFTRQGSVRVDVRDGEEGLAIAVADTGPGIPGEALDAIFDRFVQVDGSPTRRIGGTGLGLAICRELATLLGATLTVASTVGVGTTFTLTFRR